MVCRATVTRVYFPLVRSLLLIQFVLEVHGGMGRWGEAGNVRAVRISKGFFTWRCLQHSRICDDAALGNPAIAALLTGLSERTGLSDSLGSTWAMRQSAPVALRLAPLIEFGGISSYSRRSRAESR